MIESKKFIYTYNLDTFQISLININLVGDSKHDIVKGRLFIAP